MDGGGLRGRVGETVGKSAQWVVRTAGQLEEGYRRMLT